MMLKHFISILAISICLSGCASSFGPSALSVTHPAYNQSINYSIEQEMLLNLVRLRYRDSASFLRIGSVTASLSLRSDVGLDNTIISGKGNNVISPDIGIAYADNPTISYVPLQGEEFLKSVLTPISLEALLVMIQSGWNLESVFGLCIERMNDLNNAPTASGPTPKKAPDYEQFIQALSLFKQLQNNGAFEMGPLTNEDANQNDLVMLFNDKTRDDNARSDLRKLLGHNGNSRKVIISSNFIEQQENQITVRTRSIYGLLFYMSQNLQVPEDHQQAGLVTMTTDLNSNPFDWGTTPAGSVFRIKSSQEKPSNTRLAIPYRGYWFYIPDDDLQSKSTFLLLMQLFQLQAGQNETRGPTLTIPVR